jgi:mono/diheme cytochrome c family protein
MNSQRARRWPCPGRLLTAALTVFLPAIVAVAWEGTGLLRGAVVSAQAQSSTYRDVYDGWKWWHVYCYRCHGVNAIATATAPSLIDPKGGLTRAEFLKVVRDGIPDKGMQAWDQLLDDKQIGQIHLYVRARTDNVLPPGRPDEVGPKGGPWVPPSGWPPRR